MKKTLFSPWRAATRLVERWQKRRQVDPARRYLSRAALSPRRLRELLDRECEWFEG